MINPEELTNSQNQIESLFYLQVENGQQSRLLLDNNIRACGQFLKENNRGQRGVHGTAAALYVLSHSNDQSHKFVLPKLFNYIENREDIENSLLNNLNDLSFSRDSKNIIKIGEILNSLSNVNTGIVPKDVFAGKLLLKLKNSKKNLDGWSYFTDSVEQDAELLPTIIATKGILSVQGDDSEAIKFIGRECTNKINANSIDNTTYAIVILGIYTLSFYDSSNIAKINFKDIVSKLFSQNPMSLSENNEVNIEYWFAGKHEYIRIPWQVYLIALAAKHTPIYFSKLVTQERLNELVHSTASTGFIYSYSGPYISSRTNSIIYECFSHIKNNLNNRIFYEILHFIDRVREILGKRFIRYTIRVLVVLVFVCSLYIWKKETTGKEKFENIATDVITFVLFWLFSFGKKRK